ncbi:hypothetical protein TNCV_2435021 [Trichonephila clavipes]|nr:hypothetical protein TNCV_2435021 [Trichonephila clavipes]
MLLELEYIGIKPLLRVSSIRYIQRRHGCFKCKVPSQHGSTLSDHRATSLLVRLVEGEQRWEAPDHLQGVLPQNWPESELKRSVACMVFKAMSLSTLS